MAKKNHRFCSFLNIQSSPSPLTSDWIPVASEPWRSGESDFPSVASTSTQLEFLVPPPFPSYVVVGTTPRPSMSIILPGSFRSTLLSAPRSGGTTVPTPAISLSTNPTVVPVGFVSNVTPLRPVLRFISGTLFLAEPVRQPRLVRMVPYLAILTVNLIQAADPPLDKSPLAYRQNMKV